MKYCSNCGKQHYDPLDAICMECGKPLECASDQAGDGEIKRCPHCGFDCKVGQDRICLNCGEPLESAGRRAEGELGSNGLSGSITQPSQRELSENLPPNQARTPPEAPAGDAAVALSRNQVGQLIGTLGAVLVLVGVFAPLISLPGGGYINSVKEGQGDGIALLVLAAFALALAAGARRIGLIVVAVIILSIVGADFIDALNRLSDAKAALDQELAENPFRGIAHLAAQQVQLQWGWGLLIAGALMILAAGELVQRKKKPEKPFSDLRKPRIPW
jgi:hypothetical protein